MRRLLSIFSFPRAELYLRTHRPKGNIVRDHVCSTSFIITTVSKPRLPRSGLQNQAYFRRSRWQIYEMGLLVSLPCPFSEKYR